MTSNARPRKSKKGEGTVYWDKKKQCYRGEISLGYTPSGKRRRPTVYGATEDEVREGLRDLRNEHETGLQPSPGYTVEDAVTDWLRRGVKGRSEKTIEKLGWMADTHVIPYLGKAKLRMLTADDVDDWLDDRAQHLATTTLRELLALLRRVITHAQRRNRVLRNVAALITTLPEGRPGRPSKALTLTQGRAVLDSARGRRLYPYVMLSLLTGVRTEEARELSWPHTHLEPPPGTPPHVAVWRSARRGGDTKTKKSRRTLELPTPVVTVLRQHRTAQEEERAVATEWQDNELVFCTNTGRPLDVNNVRRDFQTIVKAAGIPGSWTPRELRHSFVSLMSERGVPIEEIARLVGHSNTSTTELVYRKELRPVIMGGADVMSELFAE